MFGECSFVFAGVDFAEYKRKNFSKEKQTIQKKLAQMRKTTCGMLKYAQYLTSGKNTFSCYDVMYKFLGSAHHNCEVTLTLALKIKTDLNHKIKTNKLLNHKIKTN